jgi:hypothetical protein
MEPTDPQAKIEFWQEHVKKAAEFEGTQRQYVEQNGLSQAKLSYYKSKLVPRSPSFAKLKPEKPTVEKPPMPREIAPTSTSSKLPDAKWLATLVKELLR